MALVGVKRARSEGTHDADHSGELVYLHGLGAEHETEALPGAVPPDQRTPQRCAYGLYAELLSGSPFGAPRVRNQRTWFYRVLPSAKHTPPVAISYPRMTAAASVITPKQFRWRPLPTPPPSTTFLDGLVKYCGAGDPSVKTGLSVYLYACNESMTTPRDGHKPTAFMTSDGDMLIVPQVGTLRVRTECGVMEVPQYFVAVVPRGIKFAVDLVAPVPAEGARGYVCEVYDGHFVNPDLGIIGMTGNSDTRHFEIPTAAYEVVPALKPTGAHKHGPGHAEGRHDAGDIDRQPYRVVHKYMGQTFALESAPSPFDVVGWSGSLYPFRYDTRKFTPLNTVSRDHIDPSIFTCLTVPSAVPAMSALDFVLFPPRWGVADETFRPPYLHRNVMAEFMGLIVGTYEAKEGGFVPGGASLHSIMASHGPDRACYDGSSGEELKPRRIAEGTLAFMFETGYALAVTEFAATTLVDEEYYRCWDHPMLFDAARKVGPWEDHVAAHKAAAAAAAAK